MGLFSSKTKSNPETTPEPASTPASETADTKPDLSPEEARKHAAIGKQLAAAFGELVTLVMRSETDRKRPIADLEWMIAPAISTGQFAIADAQSKKSGAISPVGAVLWALVSDDVDKRLSNTDDPHVQLLPQDWHSGTIPWIILAIGDKRVVAGLIKRLSQDVFKDQEPKIRSRGQDGKIVIGRVKPSNDIAAEPESATQ